MSQPERAGRWVLIVIVVAALLVASWSTFWGAVEPLRELGADAVGAVQVVAFLLFFLTAYNVKQRSRRSGGGGSGDDRPRE